MKILNIALLAMCGALLLPATSFSTPPVVPFSTFEIIDLAVGEVATSDLLFAVPDGRRVVIEQTAAHCASLDPLDEITELDITVFGIGAVTVGFPIPLIKQGAGTSQSWVGNLHTRIYGHAHPDLNDVGVSLSRTSDNDLTECWVSISGFLVNVR
jgi:hypothetical protein